MIQFTCKGVKQINNRISFKHLYHSYLSAFFVSAGVPNGEFPEILIAKCRSRFYCSWFFCWGGDRAGGKGVCGRLMFPAQETQSMRETPMQRGGGVNRYGIYDIWHYPIQDTIRYKCIANKRSNKHLMLIKLYIKLNVFLRFFSPHSYILCTSINIGLFCFLQVMLDTG